MANIPTSLQNESFAQGGRRTAQQIRRLFPNANRTKKVFATSGPNMGGWVDAPPGSLSNPLPSGMTRLPGGAYGPPSALNSPSPLQSVLNQSGPEGELLLGAVESDRVALQQSLDERFNRRNDILDEFQDSINEGYEDIRSVSERVANDLQGLDERNREEFKAEAARIRGEFKDTAAAQASVIALGVNRRAGTMRNQIMSSDMTPAEKQVSLQQLQQQTAEDVTAATINVASRYNEFRAQLNTQLSGQSLNVMEISANLQQQSAAIRSAGVAQAANFRAQGLSALADMIEASPVVSMATGITQLIALQQSGRVPNMSFGGGGTITSDPNRNQGFSMGLEGLNFGGEDGKTYQTASTTSSRIRDKAERAKEASS